MAERSTAKEEYAALSDELARIDRRIDELLSQREAVAADREALSRERVKATVAGKPFEKSGNLSALAEEIAVLDEAIQELERQQSALRPGYRQAERRALREEVESALQTQAATCADAAGRAQRACEELAASLNIMIESTAKMVATRNQLGAHNDFRADQLFPRMGGRIGRAFSRFGIHGLGQLQWPPERLRSEDWRAEEAAEIARNIEGSIRTHELLEQQRGSST